MKRLLIAAAALCALLVFPTAVRADETLHVDGALVQKSGSGPAVILIPGLGGGPFVYANVIPELAKRATVYAVTLPGFDGVPAVAAPYLPAFEACVRDLITREHLLRPLIVGHSLGGHLAVKLAEDGAPVGAVMAIDALPLFPLPRPGETAATRAAGAAAFRDATLAASDATYAAQTRAFQTYLVTSDANVALVADHALKADRTTEVTSATEMMVEDLGPKLPAIRVPVVVLVPAPDDASTATYAAQYKALYAGTPQLTVTPIGTSKHFIPLDQPEKFRAALDAFVDTYATRS